MENTESEPIKVGSIVKLGIWCGKVVDILTSDSTGEKFARMKLLKHLPGITEIHSISSVKIATQEELEQELKMIKGRIDATWEEVTAKN